MAKNVVLKDRNGNELNVGSKLYMHDIQLYVDEDQLNFISIKRYSTSNEPINTFEKVCKYCQNDFYESAILLDDNEGEVYAGYFKFNSPDEFRFVGIKINETISKISKTYTSFTLIYDNISEVV